MLERFQSVSTSYQCDYCYSSTNDLNKKGAQFGTGLECAVSLSEGRWLNREDRL